MVLHSAHSRRGCIPFVKLMVLTQPMRVTGCARRQTSSFYSKTLGVYLSSITDAVHGASSSGGMFTPPCQGTCCLNKRDCAEQCMHHVHGEQQQERYWQGTKATDKVNIGHGDLTIMQAMVRPVCALMHTASPSSPPPPPPSPTSHPIPPHPLPTHTLLVPRPSHIPGYRHV